MSTEKISSENENSNGTLGAVMPRFYFFDFQLF